jgi:hypothetical protein
MIPHFAQTKIARTIRVFSTIGTKIHELQCIQRNPRKPLLLTTLHTYLANLRKVGPSCPLNHHHHHHLGMMCQTSCISSKERRWALITPQSQPICFMVKNSYLLNNNYLGISRPGSNSPMRCLSMQQETWLHFSDSLLDCSSMTISFCV